MNAYKWIAAIVMISVAGCGGSGGGGSDSPEPSIELRSGPLMFSHVTFPPSRTFNLLADFNEDGLPDLMMLPIDPPYNESAGVYIRPGSPTDLFDEPVIVDDSLSADDGAVIADFDGDTHLDVILGRAILYMLPGNGDGTFDAPVTVDSLASDPNLHTPMTGDLDSDGDPDVLVMITDGSGSASDFIAAYINDGSGNFTRVASATPDGGALLGTPTDFDGDGNLDIVLSTGDPVSVVLYLGTGTGSFNSSVALASPDFCLGGVVGDVNGDGDVDFVAAGADSGFHAELVTNLGDGAGSFTAVPAFTMTSAGLVVFRYSFLLEELTGDGMLDVVLSFPSLAHWLLEGNGDGTFNSEVQIAVNDTENALVADFTGDSVNDLYLGVLIPGTGSGLETLPTFGAGSAAALVPVDLDLDGDDDLLAHAGDFIYTYLSNGDTTFTHTDTDQMSSIPLTTTETSAFAADFNGDGLDDFAAAYSDIFRTQGVVAYLNNGDGTIDQSASFDLSTNELKFVEMVAPADLDNDGNLDLYGFTQVGTLVPPSITSGSVWVAFGNGDGTFDPFVSPTTIALMPRAVASADLDGDGLRSILVNYAEADVVAILHTQSDQTFTDGPLLGQVDSDMPFAVGRFDGDSLDDIVVLKTNSVWPYAVKFYYGNASNDVDAGQTLAFTGDGRNSNLQIFDSGGVPTIVASSESTDEIYGTQLSVFRPIGTRQFALADEVLCTAALSKETHVADLNVDGNPDLITAQGPIEILRGNSSGSFDLPLYFDIAVSSGGDELAIGDWDGDGDLDVAAADDTGIVVVDNQFFN